MKVGDLVAAIDRVSATIDKKGEAGSNSILLNVFKKDAMQAAFLYTTNLVAETLAKVTCTVEEPGTSLLNPEQLRAGLAFRNPEDLVTLALVTTGKGKSEIQRLRATIGKNRFDLGYDATGAEAMLKLMRVIPTKESALCTIPGAALAQFVKRGSFCIPREGEGTGKHEMGGMRILVENGAYVAYATDGHVGARIRITGEGAATLAGVNLPQAALPPLAKLLRKEDAVKIVATPPAANGKTLKLFFRTGDVFFGSRLLEGTFPNVEGVLKAHAAQHWLTVDRTALREVLQTVGAFDTEKHHVYLDITSNTVLLRAKQDGQVVLEEQLEAENIDLPADLTIQRCIHVDYLLNIASSGSQARLKLGVHASPRFALTVDDSEEGLEALYAIMPLGPAETKS